MIHTLSPPPLNVLEIPKSRCKKNCLEGRPNGLDGAAPRPRAVVSGPPGLLTTGTSPAEAVAPTVGGLDLVRRMLCTEEGEDCSSEVRILTEIVVSRLIELSMLS